MSRKLASKRMRDPALKGLKPGPAGGGEMLETRSQSFETMNPNGPPDASVVGSRMVGRKVEAEDPEAYRPMSVDHTFEGDDSKGRSIGAMPSRTIEYTTEPVEPAPSDPMKGGRDWYATGPKNTARPGERFRGANPSSNARRK